MYLGNELELWKMEKHVLIEFEGLKNWLKTFGPRGRGSFRGENLKIYQEKIGLDAYHCKSLLNTSILIKKKIS